MEDLLCKEITKYIISPASMFKCLTLTNKKNQSISGINVKLPLHFGHVVDQRFTGRTNSNDCLKVTNSI